MLLAGRWRLVDCTWGAGYVREQTGCFHQEIRHHYLFTDPRDFIRDHFPHRSEWQLLDIPVDWNTFTSRALVKYGYFVYQPIIPECYNKHKLFCDGDIDIRLGLTIPMSISYDLFMVENNKTWINKSSHVSLHTYRNAAAITCHFLSNGVYLLHVYGKPKGVIDTPKPLVYYYIKVTDVHSTLRPFPFTKCDILWGTRYYFERVGLVQPDIFTTHHITYQPNWNMILHCVGTDVRFKVSLHYLSQNCISKHSGKCQIVRHPDVIIILAAHLIPGHYALTLSARTPGVKEYVTTMVLLLQYVVKKDSLTLRRNGVVENISDL